MQRRTENVVAGETSRFYMPSLDGLRFIAFMLVFTQHSWSSAIDGRGWIGVDIFFCISAFLFFRLLQIENKTGAIDITKFYARRILRLYPLMVAFPTLMLILSGAFDMNHFGQLAGIWFFSDNMLAWLRPGGYNTIWLSGHLWTLSYEFQVYLVIPLAFILFASVGRKVFLRCLLIAWLVSVGARMAFILSIDGLKFWVIYLTPFLRPESILIGMALGTGIFDRLSAATMWFIGLTALIVFMTLSDLYVVDASTMLLYPVVAIICGTAVWLTCHYQPVRHFLSKPWIVYLGKISFGLYVFHHLGLWLAANLSIKTPIMFLLGLALTILLATASYFWFEKRFLVMKEKLAVIPSRPI